MTKFVDIVRRKRYFQNPCGYIDQEGTWLRFETYIHKKQNSPCFVNFGNTNVDRNVVDDGVDDISQFQVDESIKW
jgi:hypothetical protein